MNYNMEELPDTFGIKKAADYLEVTNTTIRTAITLKQLKAEKIGNIWQIKKNDFKNYLTVHCRKILTWISSEKKHWITLNDLSQLLCVSYITIYRWVCIYLFFSVSLKYHRQIFISKIAVIDFIKEHPGKIIFHHSRSLMEEL